MFRSPLIFALSTLAILFASPPAQPQSHPVDGTYVRDWLVLGPFTPGALDRDFLADAGGEKAIRPREGDTVSTASGETLTWKRFRSEADGLDFFAALREIENATAYAFVNLESARPGTALLYLGSDDSVRVWLNGEAVHRNPELRALSLDEDVVQVEMTAGSNPCLVKVVNDLRGWGLGLRAIHPPAEHAELSGVVQDAADNPSAGLSSGWRKTER